MSDTRRFDELERVVRDQRRQLDDLTSTALARLVSHLHGPGDYVGSARGVRQTADLVRTNTTVTADTELTLPVSAGGVYLVDCFVTYVSTAVDIRCSFNSITGASGLSTVGYAALDPVATGPGGDGYWGAEDGVATMGGSSVQMGGRLACTLTMGGTAGTLTLGFRQDTASATSSTFKVHSWMTALRIV